MQSLSYEDFPVESVRHFLEPGAVVLLSTQWQQESNVMALGWHTVMACSPSLVGCVISGGSRSFELVRASGECVLNVPSAGLADAVIGVGNTSGEQVDKFERFGLGIEPSLTVAAPCIAQCHAWVECRVHDDSLVDRYNFFVLEVVRARAAQSALSVETLHYRGDGQFMVSGPVVDRWTLFRSALQ